MKNTKVLRQGRFSLINFVLSFFCPCPARTESAIDPLPYSEMKCSVLLGSHEASFARARVEAELVTKTESAICDKVFPRQLQRHLQRHLQRQLQRVTGFLSWCRGPNPPLVCAHAQWIPEVEGCPDILTPLKVCVCCTYGRCYTRWYA